MIHDWVELAHASKGITITPYGFYSPSTLIVLGLAKYVNQGKEIRFVDDPPSL